MRDAGRNVIASILLSSTVLLLVQAARSASGPPPLGPPGPRAPCPVPVERAGEGVRCLDEEEAKREGVAAGDRLASDGTRARMAPSRLALFAVPVDVNTASPAELESLPGIGPALAARIVAARPFASLDDLRGVPGIGARRLAAIRPRLELAPPSSVDAGAPAN